MSRKTRDPNMPVGSLTRLKDFLPPPEKLVMPEDTIKVTLLLSRSSVQFFKRQATRHRTKYQRMIRELVDRYTAQYYSESILLRKTSG